MTLFAPLGLAFSHILAVTINTAKAYSKIRVTTQAAMHPHSALPRWGEGSRMENKVEMWGGFNQA